MLQADPEVYLRGGSGANADESADAQIDSLVQQRFDAKQNKDWATADRIRDELAERGIIIEDSAEGSIWRRK